MTSVSPLQSLLQSTDSGSASNPAPAIPATNIPARPLNILQITDTHLFSDVSHKLLGLPTQAALIRVVEYIQSQVDRPDCILLTGDLSQDGSTASYELLRTILEPLGLPLYWLPGNHDCWENMARSLTGFPFQAEKEIQLGGWRFLLLNSQIPGEVPGRLSEATLERLHQQLSQHPETPTTIAFHHPPIPLKTDWLNQSALQNPDDLFQVIDPFPQVKLVLFGHIHQAFERQRQEVTYLGTPSTCIQFSTKGKNFALDPDRHPGFRSLQFYPDGTWSSQVHRVNINLTPDWSATGY